jgi:hypothetical protein
VSDQRSKLRQGRIFHRIPEVCILETFQCFDASGKSFSTLLSAKNASQLGSASQVGNASRLGNISPLGYAFQLENTSQLGNALQMGNTSQKYVGFHAPFLGRVFAFKYDRYGKVYRFFVKYSPLNLDRPPFLVLFHFLSTGGTSTGAPVFCLRKHFEIGLVIII